MAAILLRHLVVIFRRIFFYSSLNASFSSKSLVGHCAVIKKVFQGFKGGRRNKGLREEETRVLRNFYSGGRRKSE